MEEEKKKKTPSSKNNVSLINTGFNIATKTTIFVEKNVITCNIAVTKYQ
jgi:hypothetical protein